jgi:hypothetical protein
MSTTDFLSQGSLFYRSPDERTAADVARRKNPLKSNPRYPHFNHVHFTAGDTEQFHHFRDSPRSADQQGRPETPGIKKSGGLSGCIHPLYKKCTRRDITNTFNYLFFKFKKGIYVKIRDGKLKTFLPFSNASYVNEFSKKLKTKGGLTTFFKKYAPNRFNPTNFEYDVSKWYANNCLLRFERPTRENDTNICVLRDMLNELLKTENIPDIDFFVNKRDFPLLNQGKWEPYNHIWGSPQKPLISHQYDNYAPIFSCSAPDHFSDVLWPCWDDWIRVRAQEKVYFSQSNNDYQFQPGGVTEQEWKRKKSIAIWRGSSTGAGITSSTNARVKLVDFARNQQLIGVLCIDAEITRWNLRPRKIQNSNFVEVPFYGDRVAGRRLTWNQMNRYKYRINIGGHTAAYRLGAELGCGSVLLIVDCPYKLWFQKYLVEGVHYIQVNEDLSNLVERIEWLKTHDKEALQIARSAVKFYKEYLGKSGILRYLANTLSKLSVVVGPPDPTPDLPWSTSSTLEESIDSQLTMFNPQLSTRSQRRALKLNVQTMAQIPDYNTCSALTEILTQIRIEEWVPALFRNSQIIVSNACRTIMKVRGWSAQNKYFILKCSENGLQLKNEKCISERCLNATRCWNCQIPWNYRTWRMGSSFYSLLEYISGCTLYEFLTQGKLDEQKLISVLVDVINLTERLYRRHRFVHWDLAPHNIVLNPIRGPCIIDFGRSRLTLDCGVVISPSKQYVVPRKNQDISHLLVTTLYHLSRRSDASKLTVSIPWIKNIIFPRVKLALLVQETQKEAKYDRLLTGKMAKFLTEKEQTFNFALGDKKSVPKMLPKQIQLDVLRGNPIIKSLLKNNWPAPPHGPPVATATCFQGSLNCSDLDKLYDFWDDRKKWNDLVRNLKTKKDVELEYLVRIRGN